MQQLYFFFKSITLFKRKCLNLKINVWNWNLNLNLWLKNRHCDMLLFLLTITANIEKQISCRTLKTFPYYWTFFVIAIVWCHQQQFSCHAQPQEKSAIQKVNMQVKQVWVPVITTSPFSLINLHNRRRETQSLPPPKSEMRMKGMWSYLFLARSSYILQGKNKKLLKCGKHNTYFSWVVLEWLSVSVSNYKP